MSIKTPIIYKVFFIIILLLSVLNIYVNTYINSKTINVIVPILMIVIMGAYANKKLLKISVAFLMLHALVIIVFWLSGVSINWLSWSSEFISLLGGVLIMIAGHNILFRIGILKGFRYFSFAILPVQLVMVLIIIRAYIHGGILEGVNLFPGDSVFVVFNTASALLYLPMYFYLKDSLDKRLNLIGIVNVTLLFVVIFSTGWRAAQLGILIVSVMIFLYRAMTSGNPIVLFKKIIIFPVLLASVVLLSSYFVSDVNYKKFGLYDTVTNPGGIKDITSGRLSIFVGGLYIFNDEDLSKKLFGIGGGQFARYYQKYSPSVSVDVFGVSIVSEKEDKKGESSRLHPHNLFIHLLVEYGLVGLSLYFISIYKVVTRLPGKNQRAYAFSIFGSIIVMSQLTAIGYITSPLLWLAVMFVINMRHPIFTAVSYKISTKK